MTTFNTDNNFTDYYNYTQSYVDDSESDKKKINNNYLLNQLNIIKDKNKDEIPETYEPPYNDMYVATPGLFGDRFTPKDRKIKSDRYDPYGDFLYKKRLLNRDNITRYETDYINIDSSQRMKEQIAKINLDNWVRLVSNSLQLNKNSNILYIYDNGLNMNLERNNKISLNGIYGMKKNIKNSYILNDETIYILTFEKDSEYLKINYFHQLSFDNILEKRLNETNEELKKRIDRYIYNYDTTNLYITLSNIRGYNSDTYINNIPISTLNTTHRIYLYNPEKEFSYEDNSFYIKLVRKYDEKEVYIPESYNIEITYDYIGGIPLNILNAEFPINEKRLKGYHIISEVNDIKNEKKYYVIKLEKIACGIYNNKTGIFGGDVVNLVKFDEIEETYPDPNHYIIKLGRSYNNVVRVRIISSEFPNLNNNVIRNISDKLYWQNIDDGDYIYSIALDQGNYNASTLKNEIYNKVNSILRVNQEFNSSYEGNNIIILEINESTNNVIFKSYKKANLVSPFIGIDPYVNLDNLDTNTNGVVYSISIYHKNHNLKENDEIEIMNATSYYGIPSNVINTKHLISKVLSRDQYTILIKSFNFEEKKFDTNGGSSVSIIVPNLIRLRFDFPDTIGNILGFRKCGSSDAITKFNNIISNKDKYEYETNEINQVYNNALNLYGNNYIIMESKQFGKLYSPGSKIKNFFSKILLKNNKKEQVLYNTFVNTDSYFHEPLQNIFELEFNFYYPNGILFDFNGLDHSFTLELTSIKEIPKGTGTISTLGKIL